jgi:DNA uptake protein ComE-like DNA-binding protein
VPLLWQTLAVLGFMLVIAVVLGEARGNLREPSESMPHRVDINFASEAEIDALPGIGPALAREIIRSRPYSSAEELDRVKGISKKMAARLLPLVKAGQGRRAADQ